VEFLTAITSAEALRIIASFPLGEQSVLETALSESPGAVIATDIVASEDVPPFSRSLVDGYAVKAKDTYGARETAPGLLIQTGDVRVGQVTEKSVADGEAIYVATGAMVPEGADAVMMQEYVRKTADSSADLEATKSLRVGENICFKGEDVRVGQVVLNQGRRLSAFDVGVLAALGITKVPVFKKPLVGLISSGDEIVPPDSVPPPGKVRDINTFTISGLLANGGCHIRFAGIAPDTLDGTAEKLAALKECDMILLSGGSSKGQADFVTAAIEYLGGRILFHGLNIKPGKPTIFGTLWGKPVFGLPGHPVSCAMVVTKFVLPLVRRLTGVRSNDPFSTIRGRLTINVPSSYGIEEYVRVTVAGEDGTIAVTPLFAKSSVISMLSMADGYIVIEDGKEGLETGEEVEVHSFA
jgi:molybdopterin molybdotransferase